MSDLHINSMGDPRSIPIDPKESLLPSGDLPTKSQWTLDAERVKQNESYIEGGDYDGGADNVTKFLIPVQQPSLLSTFNIVVILVVFLVIVMLYYVMQLQTAQSCRATKPAAKKSQPVQEPEQEPEPIAQDQSMEGFSITNPLSSTFYGSYGGVPVKSSNSAPMNSPNSYDGQTVISNSYKNKERADHLNKMDMGPRSLTDNIKNVEYEHARKMG